MLREHGALAILFVGIAIACAVYGWRALHAPPRRAPATRAPVAQGPRTEPLSGHAPTAAEPIYVEPIPEKDSP